MTTPHLKKSYAEEDHHPSYIGLKSGEKVFQIAPQIGRVGSSSILTANNSAIVVALSSAPHYDEDRRDLSG